MRLLLLLARRAPETVTRDQMIEALWQGRVVTDDAVNKQISKVRAALTDPNSGQSLIETVPKLGVRLAVAPREPAPLNRPRIWQASAATVLLLAMVTLFLVRPQPVQVLEDPITAAPGAEFDPALTADGRMLAYVHKASANAHAELLIRPIDSDSAVRVSPHNADASAPSWSSDRKLAFVVRQGMSCNIYVRHADGRSSPISSCIGADVGGLSWVGTDSLVVSDRPGIGQSYRLTAINTTTLRKQQLTSPPSGTVGDMRPLTNRDQSAIYFLRNLTVGGSALYKVRISDRTLERLAPTAATVTSMALGSGSSLVLSAQHGSDNSALWRFSPPDSWERLMPGPAPDMAGSADGRTFVFSQMERQTVLWELPMDSTDRGRALFPSTRSDWSPVASPDGSKLAFLSDRSGSEEVWLLSFADGRARRISHFGGPSIQDLAWSPDGHRLLTSVPSGGQFDIVEIDARDNTAARVVSTPADERHASFSTKPYSIQFVRRSASSFTLMQRDLRNGYEVQVIPSVMRLVASTPQSLVFTRPFLNGVWVASANGKVQRLLAPYPDVTRARDIVSAGNTVYAVKTDRGAVILMAIDVEGARERAIRQLPDIARPSGIAIVENKVSYARALRVEADLYRLRLNR